MRVFTLKKYFILSQRNARWWRSLLTLNTLLLALSGYPIFAGLHSIVYSLFYVSQYFLLAVMLGIVLLPCFLIRQPMMRLFCLGVIEAIGLVFCFMNAKIYAFWHVFINKGLLALYFSRGGGAQVFEISEAMYVWIASAIIICVLISFGCLRLAQHISKKRQNKIVLGMLIISYMLAQIIFVLLARANAMTLLQESLAIPYFYETSLVHVLQKIGVDVYPADSAAAAFEHALSNQVLPHYPLNALHYDAISPHYNVLIIAVDTLRYDMINEKNMPNVYAFSKKTSQFLDNVSGGDCTRPGVFSLFYGIPATYWNDVLANHTPSILIRAFQENHYALKLLGSASFIAPPFNVTVFQSVKNLQLMTKGSDAAARDENVTHQMMDFLDQASVNHHPFFGFIFYDAPHAYNALGMQKPFQPSYPLNYFSVDNNQDPTPIFNLYKNAVYYDDALIQKLLARLEADGLMKNTIVIFTSDHGQEFNENHNNYWEHASGFSKYQIRTPLLIAWPGKKPTVYHEQTSHFDLTPTLLTEVLGVTNKTTDYSVGKDLFSPQPNQPIIVGNYAYYAAVENHHIVEFHDSGLYRIYDDQMRPLPTATLNATELKQVLVQMNKWNGEK